MQRICAAVTKLASKSIIPACRVYLTPSVIHVFQRFGIKLPAVNSEILPRNGICSDLKKIVEIAHRHGLKVLCDEAHGTHFYFGEGLPISGMAAGADMSAGNRAAHNQRVNGASMYVPRQNNLIPRLAQRHYHRLYRARKGINPDYVRQIINLTQTTSASYLLMASLDLARISTMGFMYSWSYSPTGERP